MPLRFGTDGVRGRADAELTSDYVRALGVAAALELGAGRWIVGRDTRESGPGLEAALASGLAAAGARVESAGVVPTPAIAYVSQADRVPAAVVTASHNPFHDNGVKLFAAGGLKLPDDIERRIEARMSAGPGRDGSAAPGSPTGSVDVAERYAGHLAALFPAGCLDGVRVVLDCANGAMHAVAPRVVGALGAALTVIHAAPDGRNINAACGATSPASLARAVVAGNAHVGLAFDGDGDRVIAVDELGNVVDGDRLIALAALRLRDEGRLAHDSVVVTVMSNLGFHRAMQRAGIAVITADVGDRYVLEQLAANGCTLGGEQSGHIIERDRATTGDGLLAGLGLLTQVAEAGRPLSELAGEVMTSYPQVLVNVAVAERHPSIADELAAEIDAEVKALEGDGRVLVRASGTEPLVRIMVEAPEQSLAGDIAERLAGVVRARFAR